MEISPLSQVLLSNLKNQMDIDAQYHQQQKEMRDQEAAESQPS